MCCLLLRTDKSDRRRNGVTCTLSDLRNYGEVLRDVAVGQPVFLTKNGRGRCAVSGYGGILPV